MTDNDATSITNEQQLTKSSFFEKRVHPDADGVVIGPQSSANTHDLKNLIINQTDVKVERRMPATTRASVSIRQSLRPLTNEERIKQTQTFMKGFVKQ